MAVYHVIMVRPIFMGSLVSETIRSNPELFFEAVNEATRKHQTIIQNSLEKAAFKEKDRILTAGIQLGPTNSKAVQFFAFVDPACSISQEFHNLVSRVLKEKKGISFRLIPVAMLGNASDTLVRFMLAAQQQKNGSMLTLLEKYIERLAQLNHPKLLELAKEAGFNVQILEKDEESKNVEDILNENMKLASDLKLKGTPTVYILNKEGRFILVPPMDVSGFLSLAQSIQQEKAKS